MVLSDQIHYSAVLTFTNTTNSDLNKVINKCFRLEEKAQISVFDGLEDACWTLVPKLEGSNPAEALDFSGRKNPQHAFLRRGSKAGGPMS
jgi:hypothetical protein